MRVVTGEAKGRKLKTPRTIGTRPIIDRVKQALFNILSVRVENARFLDLFAGTGSVGIEALSRGAAHATFIEMNAKVLALVRENLQITGLADRAETLHSDAFKFLQAHLTGMDENGAGRGGMVRASLATTVHGMRQHRKSVAAGFAPAISSDTLERKYDIIYVAPPQYQEMAARALAMLNNSPLIAAAGLIIVQIHPKERAGVTVVPLTHLALTDERRYGSTLLMFFERKEERSPDGNTITET
ncbi:MAG: 16S rRNA (guanine(966)-N(2))-methyltransferase RsmD [Ktedonobacteraceae bacterium]